MEAKEEQLVKWEEKGVGWFQKRAARRSDAKHVVDYTLILITP